MDSFMQQVVEWKNNVNLENDRNLLALQSENDSKMQLVIDDYEKKISILMEEKREETRQKTNYQLQAWSARINKKRNRYQEELSVANKKHQQQIEQFEQKEQKLIVAVRRTKQKLKIKERKIVELENKDYNRICMINMAYDRRIEDIRDILLPSETRLMSAQHMNNIIFAAHVQKNSTDGKVYVLDGPNAVSSTILLNMGYPGNKITAISNTHYNAIPHKKYSNNGETKTLSELGVCTFNVNVFKEPFMIGRKIAGFYLDSAVGFCVPTHNNREKYNRFFESLLDGCKTFVTGSIFAATFRLSVSNTEKNFYTDINQIYNIIDEVYFKAYGFQMEPVEKPAVYRSGVHKLGFIIMRCVSSPHD